MYKLTVLESSNCFEIFEKKFGVDRSVVGVASDCSVYCDEMLFVSSMKNDRLCGIRSHVEFDAESIWHISGPIIPHIEGEKCYSGERWLYIATFG